jgi:Tfp pilus assembly protein FimT
MPERQNKILGFTLMEAVVVLAVAMLVLAMARPAFSRTVKTLKLRSAEISIKRQLQAARVRALADPMVHCGVYFDTLTKPQQTRIFFDNNQSKMYEGSDITYQRPLDLPTSVRIQTISISCSGSSRKEILFRGDGSALCSGEISISNGIRTDKINVLASTGRIKLIRDTP